VALSLGKRSEKRRLAWLGYPDVLPSIEVTANRKKFCGLQQYLSVRAATLLMEVL
jgi:hypothetical protein